MIDKRFQVFVSSTYTDLIEERQQVTEQLLRLRCIPAGMELFTASGLPPWDVIKSALDTTDYMILLLAGRYGSSVGGDGRSYTEREYDYALELGIPVLPFLHAEPSRLPANQYDTGKKGKQRDAFWTKVRDSERHTVQFWTNAADLAQKVLASIPEAMRMQPRPGWVRGATESDQEGDRRPAVVLRGTSTSDDLREALAAPAGAARVERAISDAVWAVKAIPFVQGRGEFDGMPDLQAEYQRRLAALEDAARRLVQLVAAAARWGSPDLDRHLLELITELNQAPRASGYTKLIDLMRAPAVLVFTAAGLGACAGRRDELLALLLSDALEVDDPSREDDGPAVTLLTSDLMYSDGWSAQRLRQYLEGALNDDAWQESFDRAWERWQYLVGVASTYFRQVHYKAWGERYPYLRIESAGPGGQRRTTVGKAIRREVRNAGDEHPLLSKGLCGGGADLFEDVAQMFDNRYGEWGDIQDSSALSGGAGWLPSGPHYPGSREESERGRTRP
ncbi:DUF4062 domain-containing protein [Geodermatophilus sp. URMC 63]